jgi:protein ImuB
MPAGASPSDAAAGGHFGAPLVFIVRQGGAFRLHALDEEALAMGLEPGMPLADARARIPALVAVPHDPDGEAQLMERLADLCDRFTPMVAIDPPDGLVLDIAGCTHLFAGEQALGRDAARLMRAQGLRVRTARADTPEAALALARLGAKKGEEEREAVRRLPLLALRVAPDALLALRRAGFTRIGDLATLPPAPLAARFGSLLVDRLDRLLGRIDSRITPRRSPPPIRAERRFAEPVARVETVMAVLGELLGEVGEQLAERHQGGRRFAVRLYRSDGAMRDLAVETGQPVRDPAVVLRLFEERIEALSDPLDPGFGFDIVRLAVPAVEVIDVTQDALDGARSHATDLAALLDRLGVRAGTRRFRRLAPRDTHMPERVTLLLPVATPDLPGWDAPLPEEPPLRPLSLLDPPERIEVMAEVPDGPPRQFRWRRTVHRIVRQEGPERIAPEWWRRPEGYADNPGLTRDYYRIEDEAGRRFWVFRHGLYERETNAPDWYVHGLFA